MRRTCAPPGAASPRLDRRDGAWTRAITRHKGAPDHTIRMPLLPPAPPRRFLFLQGPISPFFAELAAGLRALGHRTRRINLCLGDRLFWQGGEATDYRGRARGLAGFRRRLPRAGADHRPGPAGRAAPLPQGGHRRGQGARRRGDGDRLRLSPAGLDRAGTRRDGRREPLPARPRRHPGAWPRTAPSPTWRSATAMISRCRRAGT